MSTLQPAREQVEDRVGALEHLELAGLDWCEAGHAAHANRAVRFAATVVRDHAIARARCGHARATRRLAAWPWHSTTVVRGGATLAAVIRDYLDDAEARTGCTTRAFRRSPSRDRSLRRELLRDRGDARAPRRRVARARRRRWRSTAWPRPSSTTPASRRATARSSPRSASSPTSPPGGTEPAPRRRPRRRRAHAGPRAAHADGRDARARRAGRRVVRAARHGRVRARS